jgi:two-component system, cell cycle sensor histidine kinase and response regulator CckA
MSTAAVYPDSPLVLVVDDDNAMRFLLAQALRQEGYEVMEAQNGEEGLMFYAQAHPEIVLMDALMPVMDGFTCCAQLRTLPEGDLTPVLMITCLDDQTSVDQAFAAGATDYVTKPIHWAVLRQRVRRLIETSRATRELRQQTERTRLSEQQLRLALEAAQMGTWSLDLAGQTITCSVNTAINLGFATTVSGFSYADFLAKIHPEDRPTVHQEMQQAIATLGLFDLEFRVIWPDHSQHWVASKGQVYEGADGRAVRLTGVTMDVSDRRQTEQQIRQQAALLDITSDAIWVQDLNNQILFWNKGAENLYGWTASEAIGKSASELLYAPNAPQSDDQASGLIDQGEWQGELQQVSRSGQSILVASRWTLMQDAAGQPKSILVVNSDITEQKKLEAQFLRAQRMESVGTLASGIAHDLNNSLAPILMSVQLLEKKIRDPQSQQLLSILESNTRRSADLVKQVLSFVRGLEGEHSLLQVENLLQDIGKIASQTFPRAIAVETSIATPGLWAISGDATQLHQVLMNLCVNARDAMPHGGTLKLAVENLLIDEHFASSHIDAKVGPYVVFTVSDTGIGIPGNYLDRIFEPFFTTKEIGKGTGLGLSTAIGIIKGHGGFITVQSKLDQGTTFKVYLPAHGVVEEQSATVYHCLPRGQGELILVVDDEAAIRETTRLSLETYGYEVITANDGIEAIALYAQHRQQVNAVLIDMMMPSMDGPMTIRMLQKLNPEVKIIAVSGLVSNYETLEKNGDGIQTFLPKPYTSEELLKNLQAVLSA